MNGWHPSQTASAEELGGYEASGDQQQPQQQHQRPQETLLSSQPALSPEELLLAVSRIKQERADTPTPPEEMEETAGEEREKRR